METSVQEKVIQDANQPDQDLLNNTNDHLRAGGLNTTPEDLDPAHESMLERIRQDVEDKAQAAAYAVGSTIQEGLGTDSNSGRIKQTEGEGWRQKLAQRIRDKVPFLRRK